MALAVSPPHTSMKPKASTLRGAVKRLAVSAVALAFGLAPASSGPAPTPANVNQTTAGALTGAVPDGVCGVSVTAIGGGGASSGVATGASGAGGMGAVIGATYNVLPLQAVTGAVAGGGIVNNTNGGVSTGGTGTAAGGNGGAIPAAGINATWHRGGGGGGSTSISVGGVKIIEAGGGGGGGAAHQNAGSAGNGGSTGIATGIAAGANGSVGDQITASFGGATSAQPVNGGQGGQVAAGGAGGVNNALVSENGVAGGGIGVGTGGNGGTDTTIDSGGGGGGGYTGGGGGASTIDSSQSGAGGGGGASFARLTSPTVSATAAAAITGAASTTGNPGAGGAGNAVANGTAGRAALNWVLCNYTLSIAKTASPTTVNAGAKTVWTVTVTNTGPDPMTRGDTISLTDTLPAPVAGVAPTYKVLSIASAGGSNPDMSSGAITCTGLAVGSTMPAATVCSRPYAAPGAPGAPTGGTRGLDAGETLTITYEQIFPNTAACQTVTNPVSTADRIATRNASANVTLQCYDLAVTKTASPTTASVGVPTTWSIAVTNNGPADMMGPNDTATNGLTVSDTAPVANVGAPTSFTSTGPLAGCTYTSPTISCPTGLASGAVQTFTFQQTLNNGVAVGTNITNTATVSDPKTGDANDSSAASVSVAQPSIQITKTSVGAGGTFTFNGTNGYGTDTITTPASGGTTAGAKKNLAAIGTATTVTETIPAGWIAALTSCTGTPPANYAFNTTTGALAFTAAATSTGNQINCTITNTKLPTITLTEVSTGGVGPFSFTGGNGFTNQTITTVTSGTGVAGATQTMAAVATATTITQTIPTGYVVTGVTCTGLGTGGTFTPNLAAGSVTLDAAATAAGSNIACTFSDAKLPTFTLTKISQGGVGAFTFTGNNGWTSQTITTVTSGTGVVGATQTLTALSTPTTIQESTIPAGYAVTAITCSGLGTGGTATPTLGTGTIALDAAATAPGAAIACTYTNSKTPTMKVQKLTRGKVGGPFSFAQTGLASAPAAITTTTLVAEPVAPAAITATIGTAVSLTEAVDPNYVTAGVSCTDANSAITNNTVPVTSLTATITVPAANIKPGADYTCLFTNDRIPTVKVQKATIGGASTPSTFAFTTTGLTGAIAPIATTAAATPTPAAPTALTGTLATAASITESGVVAGYAIAGVSCIDANAAVTGNSTPITSATTTVSIPVGNMKAGADYTCVFTNNQLPTITLTKISLGNVGGFTFTGNNGWTSQTITTATSGTGVTGATQILAAVSAATTLQENPIPAGYTVTAITCSNLGTGGTATPALGTGTVTLDAAATAPGAAITCTYTNTKTPTMKVQKITRGKSGGPFTFAQTGLASAPAAITTTTLVAEPAAPTAINATIGTAVSLSEVVATNYVTAGVSCSDANSAITNNTVPVISATAAVTVPAANFKAGADYTCVFTNDRIPTVKVQKTTTGGVGGPFTFSVTNLASTPAAITTAAAATPTPAAPTAINVSALGTVITINEPAIGGFFLSGATCTDANSAVTSNIGAFATLGGTTLTIPAGNVKAGADFTCVFTNTKGTPNLTVVKSASPSGPFTVGQTITYTYKVTNTGNVPVANVTVADTHNGTGVFTGPNSETLTDVAPLGDSSDATANNGIWSLLGVGDTVTFTATYVVTQHDVDFLQ